MSVYSDAVLALTPVAYWRLGEPAGVIAVDEMWTHHGTYVATPTLGATGALPADTDTAVTFNGSSQWITVPTVSDLNLTTAFTITAWAKRTGGANGAIFEKSVGGAVNTSFSLFFESGFVWGRAVKAAALTNVSSADPGDAAWHLWTLTYDGTNLRLYKDAGAPAVSASVAAPLDGGAGGSFIGVLPNLAFPFGGSLDEVAVFNRALSAAQIAALYNPPLTTARADLVAGITTMMQDYIAANPTLLKCHFRSRPPSVGTDLPGSYCDLRPETVHYANGLRDRIFTPSVVVVDRLTDNGETMDRFDLLVDGLMDHFQTYPHIIAGSIWSDMTVADESYQDGDSYYAAARFTFTDFQKTEGRN